MTDWVEDGVTPHPTGGYVRSERFGDAIMYLGALGLEHRLDGPAVEYADGTREWHVEGPLHRLDGPAIEHPDGSRFWYINGNLHRLDGPAIERPDGSRSWYIHSDLHRLDGPAVEWANGTREWWLRGVEFTEAEHAEIVGRLIETGEAPDD